MLDGIRNAVAIVVLTALALILMGIVAFGRMNSRVHAVMRDVAERRAARRIARKQAALADLSRRIFTERTPE